MTDAQRPRQPIPLATRITPALADAPLRNLALYAVMGFAIVAASLVDLPRLKHFGQMSGLGVLTVVDCVMGLIALLFVRAFPRRLLMPVGLYAAFMCWCAISALWAPPRTQGLQNAAVFLSLLVLLAVSAVAAVEDRVMTERAIGAAILLADLIGLGVVAASLVLRGLPTNIDVIPWFVHPRAMALFGLVPLSWHLAQWARGGGRAGAIAFLWAGAIFVSLSRTATAIALLLFVFSAIIRSRRIRMSWRSQTVLIAAVPAMFMLILAWAPFRNRLFSRIDYGFDSGTVGLKDNGRTFMWRGVAESALKAPFLGHGLGSSESAVSDAYYWVGHPHNDYLRVWHDLGLVGLALLVAAFATWFRILATGLRRVVLQTERDPTLQLAALGALLALLFGMMTDNSLVYGFVMSPTAVVLGAGLGARIQSSQKRVRRRLTKEADRPRIPDSVAPHKPSSTGAYGAASKANSRRRKWRRFE